MILEDKFKNNNSQEIKDWFKKRLKNYLFNDELNPLPTFCFESKKDIKDGYYNFIINNLEFQECWIGAYSQDHKSKYIKYASGSYKVIVKYI